MSDEYQTRQFHGVKSEYAKGKTLYAEYEHPLIGKIFEDMLADNDYKVRFKITKYCQYLHGAPQFKGDFYMCGKLRNSNHSMYSEYVISRIKNGTFKEVEKI